MQVDSPDPLAVARARPDVGIRLLIDSTDKVNITVHDRFQKDEINFRIAKRSFKP